MRVDLKARPHKVSTILNFLYYFIGRTSNTQIQLTTYTYIYIYIYTTNSEQQYLTNISRSLSTHSQNTTNTIRNMLLTTSASHKLRELQTTTVNQRLYIQFTYTHMNDINVGLHDIN